MKKKPPKKAFLGLKGSASTDRCKASLGEVRGKPIADEFAKSAN